MTSYNEDDDSEISFRVWERVGEWLLSEDRVEGPATMVEGQEWVSISNSLIRSGGALQSQLHTVLAECRWDHDGQSSFMEVMTDLLLSSVVSLMSPNRPTIVTTPTQRSTLAHRHSIPIYLHGAGSTWCSDTYVADLRHWEDQNTLLRLILEKRDLKVYKTARIVQLSCRMYSSRWTAEYAAWTISSSPSNRRSLL